jgi:hypothetical protein
MARPWRDLAKRLFRRKGATTDQHGEAALIEGSLQALLDRGLAPGSWAAEKWGTFWGAVGLAHLTNRRGSGAVIAVVDGWVDIENHPQLQKLVTSRTLCRAAALSDLGTAHGTEVCLLISEVAPDAEIHFYGVTDEHGAPLLSAYQEALTLAAAERPTVINISAGRKMSWEETLRSHIGPPAPYRAETADWPTEVTCPWCSAADSVAATGIPLVAAVGNDPTSVLCPARSPHVLAAGFQVERRVLMYTDSGRAYEGGELIQLSGWEQSTEVAFTITHVEGAKGSSFAAPLLSGALALGVPANDLRDWMSARFAGYAALTKITSDSRERRVSAKDDLAFGFDRLPHKHLAEDAPNSCFECSLFCEALYAEHLQYLLAVIPQDLDIVDWHCKLIGDILPWSLHAPLDRAEVRIRQTQLVATREEKESLMQDAIAYLQRAAECNPPSLLAQAKLDAINKLRAGEIDRMPDALRWFDE